MKQWNKLLFTGALPGVEVGIEAWRAEVAEHALAVCLVPVDEIAEKSPEYIEAKNARHLPLIQEAPLPAHGTPTDEQLRVFWEKAFVAKAATGMGDTAFIFDDGGGQRVATFCVAVLLQHGYAFEEARAGTAQIGLEVKDQDHVDILRDERGLPDALRIDRR